MTARRHPVWAIVLGWIGLVAFLGTALLYLAAGLMVPLYGIVLLWVLWAALLVFAIWLLRRHPAWTLAAPVISVITFVVIVQLGEFLLGWTA